MFSPNYTEIQKCMLMLVEVCFIKHFPKKSKGEITHWTLIVNEDSINKKVKGVKYKNPEWK